MLNSIQMLTHLPLLAIDLPDNAMKFFVQVKNATLIDMIHNRIQRKTFDEIISKQINERMYILDIF